MSFLDKINKDMPSLFANMAEGANPLFVANLIGELKARKVGHKSIIYVARDDVRAHVMADDIKFFAPDVDVIAFPSWDSVPYDRVSPNPSIIGRRIDALSYLARRKGDEPVIVVTTVSAILQYVPEPSYFKDACLNVEKGGTLSLEEFTAFVVKNGYMRNEKVMEPGEYAIRGGILDIFPSGYDEPLRIDLFGDDVETIRTFDAMSQRTTGEINRFSLKPMSEISLGPDSIKNFRSKYRELFGVGDDMLYEAVSNAQRYPGLENWLPLFHHRLVPIFDYLSGAILCFDDNIDDVIKNRNEQISDYFTARFDAYEISKKNKAAIKMGETYKPIPPDMLYISPDKWDELISYHPNAYFTAMNIPESEEINLEVRGKQVKRKLVSCNEQIGRDFADIRARGGDLYDDLRKYIVKERGEGKHIFIACYSEGSKERLAGVMKEHGIGSIKYAESWAEAKSIANKSNVVMMLLSLEKGFRGEDITFITEQDILGDRISRATKKKRKADIFIEDISSLNEGDLVVHSEHGIGRFEGLITLEAGGAPHDCLRILYAGNDKLFVPVENIEVLSKYGEGENVVLDKLGGTAWQSRKAKLKKHIRDIAENLIKVAAQRELRKADTFIPKDGLYEEFCAGFPFVETDDQLTAIRDVISDLASGRPSDRLVCGDVGFGKTEVAMRAAFIAAMSGVQVAVVAPTTLLVRQHFHNFTKRMKGFPVKVRQLSRMVTAADTKAIKKEIEDGAAEIIIGTHALFAKDIRFCNLGLLIIDEEQHFGVTHKEKLKELKSDIHVLTLTATPIPRTLQMSLSGVRELSLISTPPIDRLAVRTFVLPFDEVMIKEALLREKFRGGQSFYVCPRVSDITELQETLRKIVPEMKVAVAHGQMPVKQLETVMTAFSDGEYDILLSTSIIESGIDLPRVNTMIIHRADMFGLSQLYQIRGRIGRGKIRGYAYLTVPARRNISKTAERRLNVMQALDTLGAGFSIASHDMDIRGAGNILGEEQSGHIKEVGVALYQHMLEEAIAAAKSGTAFEDDAEDNSWSPIISTGMPVLIPERYVADLGVRLGLYRRISELNSKDDAELMAMELIDRFGKIPEEVENLLAVVYVKQLCKIANVEKVDAGPKGVVVSFRNNTFPKPEGLIQYISSQLGMIKIRPDQKIVAEYRLDTSKERIDAVKKILKRLASIAVGEK